MKRKSSAWMLVIAALSAIPLLSSQQTETDTPVEKGPYRIPYTKHSITVDGVLDEPFWTDAVLIPANIEVSPAENVKAPVKTEARLLYTDSHIYVGLVCLDPDPSRIRAHFMDRDDIWDDDWVLILFDTFNDQRRTYDFGCNPFGIQADMIESPSGGGDSWDAIWESDGRITDEGYIVEMAIPFRALGFPRSQEDQIWGFDVVRSYPRSVRHHIGAFPRDRNNNCYMCQSLKMVGFAGATPGRNLEFTPTFSSIYAEERENKTSGPFRVKGKKNNIGLTAKWGFTPNLTLNAALNPDFSNVEADIQQLDINNRFALYYEEKRPFFLEGKDFFSTPFNLVHTRTLADPNWGVKLTGKEGRHAIGLFTAEDNFTTLLFPGTESSDNESLNRKSQGTALRYRADIGQKSNIGVTMTNRQATDYQNTVGGVDADFRFTKADRIRVQVMQSETAYPDSVASDYDQKEDTFQGNAYHFFYTHNVKNWDVYTFYRTIDPGFRADLGFMSQAGFTYSEMGGSYKWRADGDHWYNWLSLNASYDLKRDRHNHPLHKAFTSRFNYGGPRESHINIYGEYGEDLYEGKTYRANYVSGCGGLQLTPTFWTHVHCWYGDQIDYCNNQAGNRLSMRPDFEWKIGLHLTVGVNHTWERLNVEGGRLYTANMNRVRLVYQFNKRMFLRTIFQYRGYDRNVALYDDEEDEKTEMLFTQILFSYKINPQTVFFLGYSDNAYGDQDTHFTQKNRTFFMKLGYAYMM